jgi:SSS family solute:Na+ symporter
MTLLTLLIVYSLAQIMLGLWVARRVSTSSDFFVAGRSLGPVWLFATVLAANIGAGTTVGAAGIAYTNGIAAWWWVGSAGIGSLVLAFWVGPAIRRTAAKYDLRTAGDFLEWRFGSRVRAVVAALLWFNTLTILAGQLIAISFIFNVVAGVPKAVGCILGGVVMTTYFAAGGLLSSAVVNLVQLVVLLGGFVIALPLALDLVGGLDTLRTVSPTPDYWNFMRSGSASWMYLAMLGPSFVVSPGLLQKVYGARDDRAVRLGVGANAVALLLFAFMPTLMGMVARLLHPQLPSEGLALPTLLARDLPRGAGALGLAALFSAEVSTCDAILFMLATSLSQDLYKRFVNPSADDRRVLQVARAAAIAGGVLGVALAIVAESIIAALTIFYTLMTVVLLVPIVGGLYIRRLGSTEALAAVGGGVAALIALQLADGGGGIGRWPPVIVGLGAALFACGLAMLVRSQHHAESV